MVAHSYLFTSMRPISSSRRSSSFSLNMSEEAFPPEPLPPEQFCSSLRLHRNSSYFYNGHILCSVCSDKMRPSLIFKSLLPSTIIVSIITRLLKGSMAFQTKEEQRRDKVLIMFYYFFFVEGD